MRGRKMARVLCLLLALATSIAGAGRLTTFAWDADPAWPVGTTVELNVNGVGVSGIADTQYAIDIPIYNGDVISARARAVPPAGYQCGAPLTDCQPSVWTIISQTIPDYQSGLEASAILLEEGDGMALSQVGAGAYDDNGGASGLSATLTKDSGTTVGDIALVLLSWYPGSVSVSSFSGFTAAVSKQDDNGSSVQLYYRVIDGTEGSSFSLTFGGYVYHDAILMTVRGSSALAFISATSASYTSGVTASAPSVSGSAGNGLVCAFGNSDPTTMTTPAGMTAGTVGGQHTNTGRFFFETLSSSGSTGTRTSVLGTARDTVGISVLLSGASSGSGNASAELTGQSSAGAAGVLGGFGTANYTPPGISANGLVGGLSLSGSAGKILSGLFGTGSAGLPTAQGGAAITSIGAAVAGAAGVLSLTAGANITPAGIYITGLVGNVFASAGGNVNVSLSGLSAVGNAGVLALAGGAQQTIAGLAATAGIGAASAQGGGTASTTGVTGAGSAGALSLSATALLNLLGASGAGTTGLLALAADAAVTLTGIGANGQVGTITLSAGATASIALSGVASIGQIGTITLSADALTLLTGAPALGQAGLLRLVELITPAGRLLLVESEGRLLLIEPEDRSLSIQPDGSNLNIS